MRANSLEEKKKILDSLLNLWDKNPHLRLGQLILNSIYLSIKRETSTMTDEELETSQWVIEHKLLADCRLFNIEDKELILAIEKFNEIQTKED